MERTYGPSRLPLTACLERIRPRIVRDLARHIEDLQGDNAKLRAEASQSQATSATQASAGVAPERNRGRDPQRARRREANQEQEPSLAGAKSPREAFQRLAGARRAAAEKAPESPVEPEVSAGASGDLGAPEAAAQEP